MEYSAKMSRNKTTTPGYQDFLPSRRNAVRGDQQMVYLGKYKGVRHQHQSLRDRLKFTIPRRTRRNAMT